MSFKRVLLDIKCNGHVSEDTFDEFLKIVKYYAGDLFGGEVSIVSAIETEDKMPPKKIHDWLRDNCPYKTYEPDHRFKPTFKPELKPEFKPEVLNCYDGHNPRLEERKRQLIKAITEVKKI